MTNAYGTALAQSTTYAIDAATNRITSSTDALGRVTAFTYHSNGKPLTVTRLHETANAVTTTYTYEPNFDSVASIADPLNHTTSFTYDTLGNLTRITDPLSNQINISYNAVGQPLSIADPLNHSVQFTYFGGDLATTTDALGRITAQFTDTAGRVVSVTDPLGNLVRYDYDALSRITKITDPLGQMTQLVYDGNSNLVSVTDARSGVHQYAYDTRNRQITYTDPLLQSESYQYDGTSNLTRITDRKDQVTGFNYDALNRRTQAGFGATVANPTSYQNTVDYTYDLGNRLTQVIDSVSGTVTRSADGLDRLAYEITPEGRVDYTYDAADRRLTTTVQGQTAISYAYDNADRLTSVTQGSNVIGPTYDNAGRRSTLTLPNGITVTYGYDDANQLTGLTYQLGATTLGDLTYTYDAAGRRISVGGSYARTALPTAETAPTYNAANRLTSWGGATVTYDDNGNMLSDGSRTFTWNARNQLAAISGATGASFQYDGLGRRISKTVSGTTTKFLYDSLNPIQELNGSNSPTANLVPGLNIDEFFSRTFGGTSRHLLTDALGSTIALTDASGAVQTSYTYEPYGTTTSTGSTDTNSFKYTGREDDGTGLYYYRARYYDPVLKRWISEDPVGIEAGLNLYAFVGGDPINYVDPLGLFELPSLPQSVVDFSAGMGDVILFAQGQRLRDLVGVDGGVDQCSSAYSAGEWAGIAASVATGVAGGIRAAGARGLGREFSHAIPARSGGPRSIWNGNYVTTAEHALSDPYRYRFMPRAWKAQNPMPNRLDQLWTRTPNTWKGAAGGAVYGGAGAAMNGCSCQ